MGPWEEKPKCAKIESGEKHCWSHRWLRIVKCSWLYVQNISQHIPFPTSLPVPTQALRRLARKMLRLTGEVSSRLAPGSETRRLGEPQPSPCLWWRYQGGRGCLATPLWHFPGLPPASPERLWVLHLGLLFSDRMGVIKTNVLQPPDLQYWGY